MLEINRIQCVFEKKKRKIWQKKNWNVYKLICANIQICQQTKITTRKNSVSLTRHTYAINFFFTSVLELCIKWREQWNFLCVSQFGFRHSTFFLFNFTEFKNKWISNIILHFTSFNLNYIYFFLSFQTVAYSILWDIHFLLRNFALIGALLLVVAESRVEGRSLFAGVPSLGENKPKNLLQLTGRILLAFMFITLLRFEFSVLQVIQDIFGSILMVCVTIGYKTKLSALALVLLLTALNLYYNAWWSIPSHKPLRDFLKYDFFQVIQ